MYLIRQAVVVVHGIGEQVPHDTLRGFIGMQGPSPGRDDPDELDGLPKESLVSCGRWRQRVAERLHRLRPPHPRPAQDEGALQDSGVVADHGRVFSRPSLARERASDRMYVAQWIPPTRLSEFLPDGGAPEQVSHEPYLTDFYEFYWASHYRDSRISDVLTWSARLLARPRGSFINQRVRGPERWPIIHWLPATVMLAAVLTTWLARPHLPTTFTSWLPGGANDWLQHNTDVVVIGAFAVLFAATLLASFLGLHTFFRVLVLLPLAAIAITAGVAGVDRTIAAISGLLTLGLLVAVRALGGAVALLLGDAARYLSSTPRNVDENEDIRGEIVDLLARLHEQKWPDGTPRYERIIVVGHSLGGVIAYDAVTLLWGRICDRMYLPVENDSSTVARALSDIEETAQNLVFGGRLSRKTDVDAPLAEAFHQLDEARITLRSTGLARDPRISVDQEEYWKLQKSIFCALRDASARRDRTAGEAEDDLPGPTTSGPSEMAPSGVAHWLISDLITVGCPLAYADAFMVRHARELRSRFLERTLSRCPPVRQRSNPSGHYRFRLFDTRPDTPAAKPHQRWSQLHHAAAFVPVHWTNMWFKHDLVGGPVGPVFGHGVDDIELEGSGWPGHFLTSFPHSSYWRASKHQRNSRGSEQALATLRRLIRRWPVLTILSRDPLADGELRALEAILAVEPGRPENRDAPPVAVRLRIKAHNYLPAYFPRGDVPAPSLETINRVRDRFGERVIFTLSYSHDPFEQEQPEAARFYGCSDGKLPEWVRGDPGASPGVMPQ